MFKSLVSIHYKYKVIDLGTLDIFYVLLDMEGIWDVSTNVHKSVSFTPVESLLPDIIRAESRIFFRETDDREFLQPIPSLFLYEVSGSNIRTIMESLAKDFKLS